jgi:hypothetical protein
MSKRGKKNKKLKRKKLTKRQKRQINQNIYGFANSKKGQRWAGFDV